LYTADFTATGDGVCTISVAAGAYSDSVNNAGLASNIITFTSDTTNPTMAISAKNSSNVTIAHNSSTDDNTITLTFTSSEIPVDFVSGDITVTNGSISNLTQSLSNTKVYTATFTPSGQGSCTIIVNAGSYKDAANNTNSVSNQLSFTFDTSSPTPTISATSPGSQTVQSSSTTNDANLNIIITTGEATSSFTSSGINVTNGAMSNFASISSTQYSATFTPTGEGLCTIQVPSGAYSDAAGNNNVASQIFTWTQDTTSPTMAITAAGVSSGSTTNDSTNTNWFCVRRYYCYKWCN
jgi:hypothetical protein